MKKDKHTENQNCPKVTDINISHLRYDPASDNTAEYSVVANDVKLYGYDNQAPPLYVYPDPKSEGCYIVLDGNTRLRGARANGRINALPCVIINAKSLAAARAKTTANNAPVHETREKKTLGYHCVEALIKSYADRPLTKNLTRSYLKNSFLTK